MFDDNIPMPKTKKKYNFEGIEIGQSVWEEFKPEEIESLTTLRSSMIMSAKYQNRNNPAMKFTTSKEVKDGKIGIRIWRTE